MSTITITNAAIIELAHLGQLNIGPEVVRQGEDALNQTVWHVNQGIRPIPAGFSQYHTKQGHPLPWYLSVEYALNHVVRTHLCGTGSFEPPRPAITGDVFQCAKRPCGRVVSIKKPEFPQDVSTVIQFSDWVDAYINALVAWSTEREVEFPLSLHLPVEDDEWDDYIDPSELKLNDPLSVIDQLMTENQIHELLPDTTARLGQMRREIAEKVMDVYGV